MEKIEIFGIIPSAIIINSFRVQRFTTNVIIGYSVEINKLYEIIIKSLTQAITFSHDDGSIDQKSSIRQGLQGNYFTEFTFDTILDITQLSSYKKTLPIEICLYRVEEKNRILLIGPKRFDLKVLSQPQELEEELKHTNIIMKKRAELFRISSKTEQQNFDLEKNLQENAKIKQIGIKNKLAASTQVSLGASSLFKEVWLNHGEEFMEPIIEEGIKKAIELSKKCKAEDERIHPMVGVVIVKEGKIIQEAFRGEKKPGDHAELTALVTKKVDLDFKDAILITTLEPCTGPRGHPQDPCATIIVQAGIKEVWYGILDPNPDIRGKGEIYLTDKKIKVRQFPGNYKDQVIALNQEYWDKVSKASYRADVMAIREAEPPTRSFEQSLYEEIKKSLKGPPETSEPFIRLDFIPRRIREGLIPTFFDNVSKQRQLRNVLVNNLIVGAGDIATKQKSIIHHNTSNTCFAEMNYNGLLSFLWKINRIGSSWFTETLGKFLKWVNQVYGFLGLELNGVLSIRFSNVQGIPFFYKDADGITYVVAFEMNELFIDRDTPSWDNLQDLLRGIVFELKQALNTEARGRPDYG